MNWKKALIELLKVLLFLLAGASGGAASAFLG